MAKHVNKVLVASAIGTAAGQLQFFNENNVSAAAPVATDKSFKAGIVIENDGVKITDALFSDKVTRDMIEAITFEDYAAPVASSADITIGAVEIGKRYTLRVSYNDVTEVPIQFTQSFEAVATDNTAATLADQIAAVINSTVTSAGRNARITASANGTYGTYTGTPTGGTTAVRITADNKGTAGNVTLTADSTSTIAELIAAHNLANPTNTLTLVSGIGTQVPTEDITLAAGTDGAGVLTLTAKDISVDDRVDTPYQLHQIQIGAVSLTTKAEDGTTVTAASTIVITAADKGVGYWKDVRDREKDALGYQGKMFFKDYWMPTGTQFVEKGATYSCINILYNNNYRSADMQFVKSTPLALEIYVKGATVPAGLKTAILAWANGAATFADENDSTIAG